MKKLVKRNFILSVFFLLIFAIVFSRGLFKFARNSIKLYNLRKQKKELIIENQKLKEDIKKIKSNEYIEYIARINYGLKKNIEIEYRFTPPSEK